MGRDHRRSVSKVWGKINGGPGRMDEVAKIKGRKSQNNGKIGPTRRSKPEQL